jgi:hypothetical protein
MEPGPQDPAPFGSTEAASGSGREGPKTHTPACLLASSAGSASRWGCSPLVLDVLERPRPGVVPVLDPGLAHPTTIRGQPLLEAAEPVDEPCDCRHGSEASTIGSYGHLLLVGLRETVAHGPPR